MVCNLVYLQLNLCCAFAQEYCSLAWLCLSCRDVILSPLHNKMVKRKQTYKPMVWVYNVELWFIHIFYCYVQ